MKTLEFQREYAHPEAPHVFEAPHVSEQSQPSAVTAAPETISMLHGPLLE